ncbi:MAG: ATP-binding protein [Candidatus Doudnabacteria bacterium]|nr:ATP-binding protein [Candidatus Doudnabacteria bacterium]
MFNFYSIFGGNNLDLLTVGITIAAIAILGFIVYDSNTDSMTSKTFLALSFTDIGYALVNYLSYHTTSVSLALLFLRLVMFFAVWYSLVLFYLVLVFPKSETPKIPKIIKFILFPITVATSVITLTPLVFTKISTAVVIGKVANPERGPAIALFGLVIMTLVISSIYLLGKKTFKAQGEERSQLRLVWIGILITYTLIIIFNFILPVIFNILDFIPLAPLLTCFFIAFTAYAIIKRHLLNIKVIATELLTFVLTVATLFEVLVSQDLVTLFLRFSISLLVLGIGILLIKSVRKEVEQREQLEILSKQLGEANEKLKVLDSARAEFITIASHQLRTPPATVKWYLSAAMNGDYGKMSKDVFAVVEKAAITNNHLISLIEDMLNVSRIERGKMEFLFEETNVEELASFAYEQLIPIAKNKKLTYTYNPPKKSLPKIMADKEKLRQVMNNLIDNSIKYTKYGGKVTVGLAKLGDEIMFQVEDTGKGISEEEKNTIFEKYSRGKESVKQSAGLGLGLYVAKIIIEQHKGKIWAESAGVELGSKFCFSLPINSGLKETTLVDLAVKKA